MIACALCVGASFEPYLEATLASVAPVVDLLVVNDNSGEPRSENRAVLEHSAFASDGRLRIFAHDFRGFEAMRNDAFADLKTLAEPDWILFLDADEVHGEQIGTIARDVLPRLGERITRLDGYTYHFWGTFGWISDIARRMMFYRFAPGLVWKNSVHEQLSNLGGKAIVLPYIYHHYGNVLPPAQLASKHRRYHAFGNPVPEPPAPGEATIAMYVERAPGVRPFHGGHPAPARTTIERLRREQAALFASIDAGIRAGRTPGARLGASLIGLNEELRAALRALEHPGLYRGPLEAR